jgi:transglutaminase-like putative cysteine protease
MATLLLSFFGIATIAVTANAESTDSRDFVFHYETRIGPISPGSGPVHVFVPLARTSEPQQVVAEHVTATIPGRIETEARYGNRFWHGTLERAAGETIEVRVETTVSRRTSRRERPGAASRALDPTQQAEFRDFLGANERVAVGHPILDPILAEVALLAGSDEPSSRARATYDWVVDNVEYKKVGTGWGNGDTFWACSERYGNCTDFHALFISLARTQGIPARFEIGFPVPEDRPAGEVAGYHCWVSFYLTETSWFPIDASEAFKHPDKRDHFFGTHPNDRIHLTTGRDLRLGPDHRGPPLNYFVYPHVEVGGIVFDGPIEKSFGYRETAERTAAVR